MLCSATGAVSRQPRLQRACQQSARIPCQRHGLRDVLISHVRDLIAAFLIDLRASSIIPDRGLGVDVDKGKALEWLRRSAELGFQPAVQELASCLKKGSLGVTDEIEAAEWERKLEN